MDEIVDEKWKNFLMNIDNICLLCENLNKRNKVEIFYVGLFWKFWHMKCSNHTSNRTSYFINMKYIQALQHPNHI